MGKNIKHIEEFNPIAFILNEDVSQFDVLRLLNGKERVQTYTETDEEHYLRLQEEVESDDKAVSEAAKTDLFVNQIHSINSVIRKHAGQFAENREILNDLLIAGYFGALDGLRVYDPKKGTPTSIITWYIVKRVAEELRVITEVTQNSMDDSKRIKQAIELYKAHGVENPTDMDIAIQLGEAVTYIRDQKRLMDRKTALSLDDEAIAETVASPYFHSPEAVIGEQMKSEAIADAIEALGDDDEIEVIRLKYFENLSINEICEQMHLDKSHVDRILSNALIHLSRAKTLTDFAKHRVKEHRNSVIMDVTSAADMADQIMSDDLVDM